MNRKNICFITQCNLPVPAVKGGAVESLVEFLIKENENKPTFNITVISISNIAAKAEAQKYRFSKFIFINPKNKILNKFYSVIYKILKKIGIYIPFCIEYYDVYKYLKKSKDLYDFVIYEAGPTTQVTLIQKIVDKKKILVHLHWDGLGNLKKDKSFNYLIPVSNYIGQRWQQTTGRSNNKIKVLPNCVNTALFQKRISKAAQNKLLKKLKINSKDFIIIFIGRIVPEKGVLELIKAINLIKKDNITLLIVGSSNFGKSTKTKYERKVYEEIKKSQKKIVQVGYVPNKNLFEYYSLADIAVMPSVFEEPAGMVCIEAQSYGIPLIVTKVGGLPEYCSNSTILVEKENLINNLVEKITFLYEHPEVYEKMITEGKSKSIIYNTKTYFENFKKIISEIGGKDD